MKILIYVREGLADEPVFDPTPELAAAIHRRAEREYDGTEYVIEIDTETRTGVNVWPDEEDED